MKYTIMGFSQEKLIEFNLDLVDVTILRWFVDFRGTESMIEEIHKGKTYYWVDYKSLIADIPIIGLTSKDVLRRRLKTMVNKGILIHYTKKKNGTYSFYSLGKNYKSLISVENRGEAIGGTTQKSEGVRLKSRKVATQKSEGYDSKVGTKYPSTKDQSSKNNLLNNNTEILNTTDNPDETNNIKNEIENTLQCKVNIEVLKKTIKKNNLLLDDIRYYLTNWSKFDYKTKKNPIGFLLKLVINKVEVPKVKKGFTKPDQSYNFEQRVYDDDYFDSLYDNF